MPGSATTTMQGKTCFFALLAGGWGDAQRLNAAFFCVATCRAECPVRATEQAAQASSEGEFQGVA
jgi:hypothetical protein